MLMGIYYIARRAAYPPCSVSIPSYQKVAAYQIHCRNVFHTVERTRHTTWILLDLPAHIEPELAALLHTSKLVFHNPTRFPPSRQQDHCIPLLEGSKLVKVKPYRYPDSQKEQIEKMVKEMLQQGIIRSSTSLFFSPILLVEKKGGTWRFSTD